MMKLQIAVTVEHGEYGAPPPWRQSQSDGHLICNRRATITVACELLADHNAEPGEAFPNKKMLPQIFEDLCNRL